MAETVTPPGRIAGNQGTVATALTTTFRGLGSTASLKASADVARDP